MKISIFNTKMERTVYVGGTFVSCFWREEYNGCGAFALSLQESDFYRGKIKPGYYAMRQDRPTVMVIKSVVVRGGVIELQGRSAASLLDDVAFIGTIKPGAVVAQAIEKAYNNSSKFPLLHVIPSSLPDTYAQQTSNKPFLELVETMCRGSDLGFRAIADETGIGIEFYKPPVNEGVAFSEAFGNLKDPEITLSNANYKNYAIVLGGGSGAGRDRVDVDLSGGQTRREMIVDARDLQPDEADYQDKLTARGVEKLMEQAELQEFRITPSAAGFGSLFELGDIVPVSVARYGISMTARLSAFDEKEQSNSAKVEIEIRKR